MKTTVDLPEALLRRAKSEAALRGQTLRELVELGLRRVLDDPQGRVAEKPLPSAFDLMKGACGVFDSGVTDLASNPRHLEGFGSDSMGHR